MKIIGINQNNGPNFEYKLTKSDILWSLKMIYGESGNDLTDAACVLWCMANRLVLLKDKYKNKTFEKLIRAYSQPINPRWYRDGDLGKLFMGKDASAESRFKRREVIRDMKEEEFPEKHRKLIELWLNGEIPNPVPNAVDFAVPGVASKSRGTPGLIERGLELVYDKRNRGTNCVDRFGNVFYATPGTTKWPANKVRIESDSGVVVQDSSVVVVKNIILDKIK